LLEVFLVFFIIYLRAYRYAHENGCSWFSDTCASAARGGSLACLTYAHENGCDWDILTTYAAAETGKMDCLR
jgi:hypothetical protein